VIHAANVPEVIFKRSTWCSSGNCAEVAFDPGARKVLVRNSGTHQELEFKFHEWSAFVAGVKAGEFELP
jgi:hypothetical protein